MFVILIALAAVMVTLIFGLIALLLYWFRPK